MFLFEETSHFWENQNNPAEIHVPHHLINKDDEDKTWVGCA